MFEHRILQEPVHDGTLIGGVGDIGKGQRFDICQGKPHIKIAECFIDIPGDPLEFVGVFVMVNKVVVPASDIT